MKNKVMIFAEILDYITENNIFYFDDLIYYASENKYNTWFKFLCDNDIVVSSLVKILENKKMKNDLALAYLGVGEVDE